jgi:hypothetical protein
MVEVFALDEFDLLADHNKPFQVLESFTDSSEDMIERLKPQRQPCFFDIFFHVLA